MSGLTLIADELVALLEPIADGVQFPTSLQKLLQKIGVPDAADAALTTALTAVVDFGRQCEDLASASQPSFESAKALLEQGRKAFNALSALTDAGAGATTGGFSTLGQDLAELLVGLWLAKRHPRAYTIGILLSLIRADWDQQPSSARSNAKGDAVLRYGFKIDQLQPGRIVDLIRDPVAALRAEYGNALATDADAAALADKLFPRLQLLFSQFGLTTRYGISPNDAADLKDWAAPMAHALVIYVQSLAAGSSADAGVVVTLSPTSQGDLGLVFAPFGDLNISQQLGSWSVDAKFTAGVDVVAWGRNGATLLSTANSANELTASVTSTLPAPSQGPAHVFGSPTGTRLEIGGAAFSATGKLSQTASSLALSAAVSKSTLVIAASDSDGFVSSVLPAGGLRADFNLGVGWSNNHGLTLSGGGGLDATLPVGVSLGGVTFSAIHLSLNAQDGALNGEISGSLSASIGPIQASIERVGLSTALTFPSTGGNLGVADIAFGLKPPSGVGLAIDAHAVLTGGGFLSFDSASGNYGGVLQLSLHDSITLTGYGLIATRMPDGSHGFSLLVFITADGFEPIPLGFGFVLQSIGGMLGINRTFDLEVVRSGLKSDNLAQLLFPRDPVANAPALLHALAATFPIRAGSYLIGLLARITWFTPTLVTLDLALILELGARTRLLALGRVSALLPTADNDLIRLNMDSDGVLDFDAGTFEADAALFDSRIVHQFPITGSAALRARWSGDSTFVLAIGGLNPHFSPPAGFPALTRVSIALCSGSNPRLICDAYFAITSNTVQFGSHVSLHAEAFGASVDGDLGFDALVSLRPPHFLIDIHAAVQLKAFGLTLFKVTLDGTLEGPLPLRLAAKVSIEILFFSFSVHFNFTLADGQPGQMLPSVALEDQVKKALTDPASWSTLNALHPAHGVSLRSLPASAGPVLDPLGQLVVQQQVAPLNTQRAVDTFDGVAVAGAQHFQFNATFDGQAGAPVSAAFAPARYFKMSDDDKLAAPSFETMQSGAILGDTTTTFDPSVIVSASLGYDEFVVGPTAAAQQPPVSGKPAPTTPDAAPPQTAPVDPSSPPTGTYALRLDAFKAQRASGAAGRAPLRRLGRARFRNPKAVPAATLQAPTWQIVQTYGGTAAAAAPKSVTPAVAGVGTAPSTATPSAAPPIPAVSTWSEGQAKLGAMVGDRWAVVPAHEVKSK